LSEGTTTAGGFLVPSPISARVWDVIRAQAGITRAGVTVLPMASNTLDCIKVTTGPTAAWIAENTQGSNSDIVLARIQLNSQTLVSYAQASIELVQDSDPSLTGVLEATIAGAMATELDRACLDGSGSVQRYAGFTMMVPTTRPGGDSFLSPANYLKDGQLPAQPQQAQRSGLTKRFGTIHRDANGRAHFEIEDAEDPQPDRRYRCARWNKITEGKR
jgi:HK97 family phage major capsid protein